uniref:Uncharacterized protein n=1 Tax=Ananas comosus var. bracteatus TaxID=296719 RepID=A0A6V7P3E5_ANACO|nr:unnamed protein product [Ananas comosus var. bracteatus]
MVFACGGSNLEAAAAHLARFSCCLKFAASLCQNFLLMHLSMALNHLKIQDLLDINSCIIQEVTCEENYLKLVQLFDLQREDATDEEVLDEGTELNFQADSGGDNLTKGFNKEVKMIIIVDYDVKT